MCIYMYNDFDWWRQTQICVTLADDEAVKQFKLQVGIQSKYKIFVSNLIYYVIGCKYKFWCRIRFNVYINVQARL